MLKRLTTSFVLLLYIVATTGLAVHHCFCCGMDELLIPLQCIAGDTHTCGHDNSESDSCDTEWEGESITAHNHNHECCGTEFFVVEIESSVISFTSSVPHLPAQEITLSIVPPLFFQELDLESCAPEYPSEGVLDITSELRV